MWSKSRHLRYHEGIRRSPPRCFPPGAVPPDFPPPASPPPRQVPTRSFPTRPFPPPGSYTPLRIQESTLLKGELSPNIWTFLKVLQKEQALNEIEITQITRCGGACWPASTPTTPPVPRIWTAYSTYS